ncbi:RNA-binding protein, putative [Plasmodium chabaudi adami]|uniref:RNA-binding protein, putative n=1 Tax=Plasmodium chabaudi adami TaxID=5826 RepID=A0A1C6XJV4_PLACE|nr:RNA-binding protein, putative [Plasmodium chabaudi adami]
MKSTFYEPNENSSSDNMNEDFLNYPNFKKFIDNSNHNDNEHFEESRKYIHREITRTLNANSMKSYRNTEESHLQNSCHYKYAATNAEVQNKKEFSNNSKDDIELKRPKNYSNYGNYPNSNYNNCINYKNANGKNNNAVVLPGQKTHAIQNEPIMNDHKNGTNNGRKKNEITYEDENKIVETLLNEKKNLLKHEFFYGESQENKRINQKIENFIFTNEEKLSYSANNNECNKYEVNRNNDNVVDNINMNVFSHNEFNNIKKNNLVSMKDGEKMNNQNGNDNVDHHFNNQDIEKEYRDKNSYINDFKSKIPQNNSLNNAFSNAFSKGPNRDISNNINNNIGVNNMNSYRMSGNNMYRCDTKNIMQISPKNLHEKKENCKIHRIENNPSKLKKYNNLKEIFYLNSNQRHFYPNIEHIKNKSEFFLRSNTDERIYANNMIYDDYFTIENLEKSDGKKECFRKGEYKNNSNHSKNMNKTICSINNNSLINRNDNNIRNNHINNIDSINARKDNVLRINFCKGVHRKELISNKMKNINFMEKNNKIIRNNTKDDYFNENNMNELLMDDINSEQSHMRKDYIYSSINTNEETSNISNDNLKDAFLLQNNNDILLQNVNYIPQTMHSNNFIHTNENFMYNKDYSNDHMNTHISNVQMDGIKIPNSLMKNVFSKKNTYQNKNDMDNFENYTLNERRDTHYVSCFMHDNNGNNGVNNSISTGIVSALHSDANNGLYNDTNSVLLNVTDSEMHNAMLSDNSNNITNAMSNGIHNKNGGDNMLFLKQMSMFEDVNMNMPYDIMKSKDSTTIKVNEINENDDIVIKLFFGNLAPITTEKDMHTLFSNFGKCDSLIILKDRRSKSRGSGFVTFYNMKEAINAIKNLNNKIILSGAHKPLEVRFPENKEEKKLRTKLLNAAKWKGKKIAPSGCLPINTEDILNQNTINLNSSSNISAFNANDSSYFISENDNTSYIHKDPNNWLYNNNDELGCSSVDQLGVTNVSSFYRQNEENMGFKSLENLNCGNNYSELQKTISETTNDTINGDYYNRFDYGHEKHRYNSFELKKEDNVSGDINIDLLMQEKNYSNLLPQFLFDNKFSEKLGENSFEEMLDLFTYDSNNANNNNNSNNSDLGGKEFINKHILNENDDRTSNNIIMSDIGLKPESIHGYQHIEMGKSASSINNANMKISNTMAGNNNNSYANNYYMNNNCNMNRYANGEEEDYNNLSFSKACNKFEKRMPHGDDADMFLSSCIGTNCTFIDEKDRSYKDHYEGNESYVKEKLYEKKTSNICNSSNSNITDKFCQRDFQNIPEEIDDIVNEDNDINSIYESNTNCDGYNGYNNINVHCLGFKLSHLLRTNDDVLLKNNSNNTCSANSDQIENKENNIIINDYRKKRIEGKRDNNIYNMGDSNPNNIPNKLIDDNNKFNNNNFEFNDNLSDEMLKNMISIYATNKSSIFTSHMFNYLNNVLCEINNALEIFNKFNVKDSIKNINDRKKFKK